MRSFRFYLEDIVESGAKVLGYTSSLNFERFLADERTFDAVVRNLEVIGEVVKDVPREVRDRYPEVEWRKIAGLHDGLIHTYFSVEAEILWDVVENKIPQLVEKVKRILEVEERRTNLKDFKVE